MVRTGRARNIENSWRPNTSGKRSRRLENSGTGAWKARPSNTKGAGGAVDRRRLTTDQFTARSRAGYWRRIRRRRAP